MHIHTERPWPRRATTRSVSIAPAMPPSAAALKTRLTQKAARCSWSTSSTVSMAIPTVPNRLEIAAVIAIGRRIRWPKTKRRPSAISLRSRLSGRGSGLVSGVRIRPR